MNLSWRAVNRAFLVVVFKVKRLFYQQDSYRLQNHQPQTLEHGSLFYLHNNLKSFAGVQEKLTADLLKSWAQDNNDKLLLKAINLLEDQAENANISWDELSLKSELLSLLENTQDYEGLLISYDPNLELMSVNDVDEVRFVAYGLGYETLNSYRYIRLAGIEYFEKVYLSASKDLEHLLWFHEFAQEKVIELGFQIPRILKINQSNKLTVIYFEYFPARIDNLADFLNQAIEIALKLYQLPIPEKLNQPLISDFENHQIYKDNFRLVHLFLKNHGVNDPKLIQMLSKVKAVPKQFCHGDLHGKNIGQPNVLIDWDRAGLYPLGFDIAYIFSNRYDFIGVEDWLSFLELKCKPVVGEDKWQAFVFSTAFFALVFYSRKLGKKILPEKLVELYYYLETQLD